MWNLQTALIFVTLCLTTISGCKNGKVEKSCESMMPEHHSQPNTTASPYTLTVNASKFSPGDDIRVTLSGSEHFEGFLIQGRDATNPDGSAIGSFTLIDPKTSQRLTCNSIEGSAVSHTSNVKKTEIQVIWNAPSNAPPTLQFFATVLAHYKIFWLKVPGPVISQHGVTPAPPQSTTIMSTISASTSIIPQPFTSDGCGRSKSCLIDPAGCNPSVDTNCFYLSYFTSGQKVSFELSGPAQGYVSFALSKDKWMGDDDAYLCIYDEGRVSVETAHTTGRTYPEVTSKSVLTDVGWRVSDGVIQCKFSRSITPQDPVRFSLNNSYYLFIAHGNAEYGMIHRHTRQPLISSHHQIITGPPEILTGSRSPLLMKYHGALMLIAWMLAGSTGMLMAGYFKPNWPEQTLFGQKIWFQVHRILMSLTVLFTAVGFIFPFIYRGKWSTRAGAHPYLGCIAMILAFCQLIMAAFRPAPDSSRRWIFNWLHWGVGNTAEIIAVMSIFFGIKQQSLLLPYPWTTGVLAAFVVWTTVLKLVLQLHKHAVIRKAGSGNEEELPILSNFSGDVNWNTKFRVAVLVVFVLGNSTFCIALLAALGDV